MSPDSLVPDPGMVIDYNRFLYVRGNPLTYADPSGHESQWVEDWHWKNRYYEAHGFKFNPKTNHWDIPSRPIFADDKILHAVMRKDLIGWLASEMYWTARSEEISEILLLNHLSLLALMPFLQVATIVAKTVAYQKWTSIVASGKALDYKERITDGLDQWWHLYQGRGFRFDLWANISYGYVGRAAGFTSYELAAGAGLAQVHDKTYDAGYLQSCDTLNILACADDPLDREAIRFGIRLYEVNGLNIDKATLAEALQMVEWTHLSKPEAEFRLP